MALLVRILGVSGNERAYSQYLVMLSPFRLLCKNEGGCLFLSLSLIKVIILVIIQAGLSSLCMTLISFV
jgi:hypothetical protein